MNGDVYKGIKEYKRHFVDDPSVLLDETNLTQKVTRLLG